MTDLSRRRFDVVNGRQVILLVIPPIFFALATIAVAARWYARKLKRINTIWEDAFCLAGLLMSFVVVAIIFVLVFLAGQGTASMAFLRENHNLLVRYWLRTQFSVDICWATSVTAVQLAFLNFYLRLYEGRPLPRMFCYFLITAVALWYAISMGIWISRCHPPGTCGLPGKAACAAIGSFHVAFNALIMVIPIPAVLNMRLSAPKKLCTICAVLRMDCVLPFFKADYYDDPIGASWGRMLFSPLEIAVGIIICCVPNLTSLHAGWREQRRGHLPKEGTGLRRLKIRSSSNGSSTSNLNPAMWVPRGTNGQVNAFVSLDDGGKSNERVKDLGPQEIRVVKEYNVGHRL
ncbi:hypothetical protein BDV95DRAFT_648047 [Massariosphaeria phaeospora]|uniref:Rhodopsin domain-containing protein n=1 Tax=Massariosphaeria phaeospora TaxID=100035 RepID=A0A7C8M8Z3_9PLEO|nr:hypothetical protein BDV95DRAFT_648047 [Massariosphaeria phaeospora]